MKRFKTIENWLETNPSEEEKVKVLNLIHRGATHDTRKEIYEKERYLNKLLSSVRILEKIEMKPPKDVTDRIKETKSQIDELKKGLPAPVKRAKKEKSEVV